MAGYTLQTTAGHGQLLSEFLSYKSEERNSLAREGRSEMSRISSRINRNRTLTGLEGIWQQVAAWVCWSRGLNSSGVHAIVPHLCSLGFRKDQCYGYPWSLNFHLGLPAFIFSQLVAISAPQEIEVSGSWMLGIPGCSIVWSRHPHWLSVATWGDSDVSW